jgi:hypothetical protein
VCASFKLIVLLAVQLFRHFVHTIRLFCIHLYDADYVSCAKFSGSPSVRSRRCFVVFYVGGKVV